MPSTLASPTSLRPDEKPLAEYRAVSRAALAAAGLGVASAAVLLTPLLAPVAVAAAITAALALRAIGNSKGQLVGRVPALAGLCLAALFLAWGVAQNVSRQAALEANSRRVCGSFFKLIQDGQFERAHQYKLPPANRISDAKALKEYYAQNIEAQRDLQAFKSQAGVLALVAAGSSAKLEFGGLTAAIPEGFTDHIQVKYTLQRSPSQGGPLPLWINLARRRNEQTGNRHWEVASLDTNPPPSAQ